jgi:hypothetical protein
MARLFVAVRPPTEVVALLAALDGAGPGHPPAALPGDLADRSAPGAVRFEELATYPLEGPG